MIIDISARQFVLHPDRYHLESNAGTLKAVEGMTQKIHLISSNDINHLKTSAATDTLAGDILLALRSQEKNYAFSTFGERALSPPLSDDFEDSLIEWCEEAIGMNEYLKRLEILKKIKQCDIENLPELDLSNLSLSSLPAAIGRLTHLKKLDASGNGLTKIPEELSNLVNLEELGLSYNKIAAIPDSFGSLTKLKSLSLINNRIKEIPDSFGNFIHLKKLDLSINQISKIPDSFDKLVHLRELNLSENEFEEIPHVISSFVKLKKLDLSGNKITDIPIEFSNLPNLKELNLKFNSISIVPIWISKLTSLKWLYLNTNQITTIPYWIDALIHLKKLGLSENQITEIPKELCNLEHLKELNLNNNQIIEISEEFIPLASLEDLDLSENLISAIPVWISNLITLKKLHLNDNQITEILDEFTTLKKLEQLDLNSNKLIEIPDQIFDLTTLKELELSNNLITEIPNKISQLTSLQNLNLGNNQIVEIPGNIATLSHLNKLFLVRNQFSELPNELASLPSSCLINITSNKTLASSIQNFKAEITRVKAENPLLGPELSYSIYEPFPLSRELPLKDLLTFWQAPFQPSTSLKSTSTNFISFYEPLLLHEKRNCLRDFLEELQYIADFTNPQIKQNVILRVHRMLMGALTNKDFREKMFVMAEEALGDCEDRIALVFNQIEIRWHIYCGSHTLNDLEISQLLVGLERIDMLDKIARKHIVTLGLGDHVEVFLYFQIKLKDHLNLPLLTEEMHYPDVSCVSDRDLKKAKKTVLSKTSSFNSLIKILVQSEEWVERIKKANQDAFEKINSEIVERMSKLPLSGAPGTLYDNQTKPKFDKLEKEQKARAKTLLLRLTQKWVKAHHAELLSLGLKKEWWKF